CAVQYGALAVRPVLDFTDGRLRAAGRPQSCAVGIAELVSRAVAADPLAHGSIAMAASCVRSKAPGRLRRLTRPLRRHKSHGAREVGVARAADIFVEGPGDDGHLVDPDPLAQLLDARRHLGPGADEGALAEALDARLVEMGQLPGRNLGR